MRKTISVLYFLTQGFLLVMFFVGCYTNYQDYRAFGWQYQQTTIINEVSVVKDIYVWQNFIAVGLLLYLSIILYILRTQIKKLEKTKEEELMDNNGGNQTL